MAKIKQYGPKCPNHYVELVSCQRTSPGKGIGICPISTARFTFEEKHKDKLRKLKFNSLGKAVLDDDYKVTGKESIW